MLEEAQIQSLLDGKIPDIDRLKLFSAIKIRSRLSSVSRTRKRTA